MGIACATGWTIDGALGSYTCDSGGSFAGTPPTCTANECTALILDAEYNSTDCVGKVTAETCSIACATGWTIDGALGSYTCDSGGSFAGTPPTCTANECTAPAVDAGYNNTDCVGKVENETCSIACAAGWTITGAQTVQTCQADKTFTGDLPTCTANTCTALNSGDQYDDTNCTGTATDETCSIACAAGWTIAGSPGSQTCQADKTFTGDLPNCTAK